MLGLDKNSLVADLVRRADRASTQRALLTGSKARFGTASAVPLIDLLMQAIGAMLRAGTSLPLNRSGAAGWVYDGSLWFVAKRIADSVRDWIKTHQPDEAVPGDTKNDRLFDTWQEYGCIDVNPQTHQAVWYVTVHGSGLESHENEAAAGKEEQGAYSHSLTMLRFPLAKLYEDAAHHPPEMRGRIEVHSKRRPDASAGEVASAADNELDETAAPHGLSSQEPAATDETPRPSSAAGTPGDDEESRKPLVGGPRKAKVEPSIKEPAFNKPRIAAKPKQGADTPSAPSKPLPAAERTTPPTDEAIDHDAALLIEGEAPQWLDGDDDVSAAMPKKLQAVRAPRSTATTAAPQVQPLLPRVPVDMSGMVKRVEPRVERVHAPPVPNPSTATPQPAPVVLQPKLPELPKRDGANVTAEPSELALDFMRWVQNSLVSRELKYNETGAAVHFTAEGLALVSPNQGSLFSSWVGNTIFLMLTK